MIDYSCNYGTIVHTQHEANDALAKGHDIVVDSSEHLVFNNPASMVTVANDSLITLNGGKGRAINRGRVFANQGAQVDAFDESMIAVDKDSRVTAHDMALVLSNE
ncbi:hypothetical protein [Actinomyces vulturis]|uniref:hypothetical protein n=1 Tax=Actinomyces vulturis TaxID=1857645 RepID=UPI00082F450F|nr:hypothetical protein [Actinomyces vulturis]